MKKVISIIGTRPQIIKMAALDIEISKHFKHIIVNTGQHYDKNMNDIFFNQLKLKAPKYDLKISKSNQGKQTGKMIIELEKILVQEKPDVVIVIGDTNSTLAGAIVSSKLNIPLVHVEAGLRSFNKEMPEEINRIITDQIASILFCPSIQAQKNLFKENVKSGVYIVGDLLADMIQIAKEKEIIKKTNNFETYYFATIHRPYNTDNENQLSNILNTFQTLDKKVKFCIHPRTLKQLKQYNVNLKNFNNIEPISPLSYFESLQLQYNAKAVLTDSGGMQKEAYILKKKCITIRKETEWKETLKGNWNTLVFNNLNEISKYLKVKPTKYVNNVFGLGKSANLISSLIKAHFKFE